jgi:ATP-binding cassette, subfamily B, bacterial MsbA
MSVSPVNSSYWLTFVFDLQRIATIFQYIKGRWNLIVVFCLSNLLSVIFSMLSLAMLVPFLNLLFGKDDLVRTNPGLIWSKDGIAQYFKYILSDIVIRNENNKMYALLLICLLVLGCIVLKNFFLFVSRYILHPLRNGVILKMRRDLYHKILNLPLGFFTNERKGDVMARMTNDIKEIEDSIISVMDLLFSAPISILFYLIFMLSLSVKLCLILFVLLPLAGILIGRISKSLKKHSTDNSQRIGTLLSIIDETLSGLRIIKAFGAEHLVEQKYDKENTHLNQLNNRIALRREMASPLSETLGIVVLCVILCLGGYMVLDTKEIDAGTFILFILVFTQLLDPLKKFSQIFYNIQKGSASLDRINTILHADNLIEEPTDAQSINKFGIAIELRNVSFQYGKHHILHNINLTIPKGKTLALVGSSGSGKSTLVDLIPRFHDCSTGEVLLDGVNIRSYKIADLRSLIGVVSQEPILFNDTIANNIALAMPTASIDAIHKAAEIANAHQYIVGKPQQYQENIGDRGQKLSGGEKQRLTIARAVLKNPPILILDEATSSLDTESERLVQDALTEVMKDRTCIIIAHRLSTVQHADEIVVMDKGAIAERGTHAQLIAANGIYMKLVQMQQLS